MKNYRLPVPDGKIFLAVCILFLCIESALWAYRNVYMKTPEYSLQVIITAARSGDTDTLDAMIDEKNMAAELYDGIATKNNDSTPAKMILQLAWMPLRNDFAADMTTLLHGALSGDTSGDDWQQAKKSVDDRLKSLDFPLPTDGWQYQSASWSHKTKDGYAEMTLTFYNTVLQTSVPVTVSWERAGSRSWHIIGLADASGLTDTLQTAYTDRLAAYNETIQKKLDQAVKIRDVSARLVRDADSRQTFLRIQYTPVFASLPEPIQETRGTYELRRASDHAVLYSGDVRLTPDTSGKNRTSQFLLNPFIPSQYSIINRTDLNDTESVFHITAITMGDGTALLLADHLPEE
ncbi:MAG: hypothetical protein LKG17_02270 [Megasphaera sp.]|jgi:hypothetical protein|nr:hypothetical protein [Megasphaera sp.]